MLVTTTTNKKHRIAGVDEVGRGPLAGPLVTAAVILDKPIEGLMDSKKLSEKKRRALAARIEAEALCFAYGRAEVEEIDRLNIHQATLLAMSRAIEGLSIKPDEVLIDGQHAPTLSIPFKTIIGGDNLVDEISAASIIAKVKRDEEMVAMDKVYQGYGFSSHKGYGTVKHRQALIEIGPCAIHRKSFAPVADLIRSAEAVE